jgi:ABC-2 type transport system permease protein
MSFRKFLVEFRAAWFLAIEYRISVFIWIIAIVLPLIMLAAWLSIAQNGSVGNFDRGAFISYYLAAVIVRNMTGVWFIWEMDRDIRLGELSFRLLRPMNPIIHYMALSLSSKPLRVVLLVPATILVLLYVPGVQLTENPALWIIFMLSLAGSWAILFLTQYIIGLFGFWITQSLSLNDVWFGAYSLCSGYLIPLTLLPPPLRQAFEVLPFQYTMSFPINVLRNQLTAGQAFGRLLIQWVWVLVFYSAYRFVWLRGLKRYSAVGA